MNTLRIIGAGIAGVLHFTKQALNEINACKKVLWLGTVEGMNTLAEKHHWLGEEITHLYVDGAVDNDNYFRICQKIAEEIKNHGDITLVVLGHPRFGVTIIQEIQDVLGDEVSIKILPGISSFDTMINDLALDPLEEGTCLLDVNRLLMYDYVMDPCINYFIYHVCSIGTEKTHYSDPTRDNAIPFLKKKLLAHFVPKHKAILISSSGKGPEHSTIIQGEIGQIETILEHVTFSSTLFIPGKLPSAEQINNSFYQHALQQN